MIDVRLECVLEIQSDGLVARVVELVVHISMSSRPFTKTTLKRVNGKGMNTKLIKTTKEKTTKQ